MRCKLVSKVTEVARSTGVGKHQARSMQKNRALPPSALHSSAAVSVQHAMQAHMPNPRMVLLAWVRVHEQVQMGGGV